jgi:hypothetical protein
MIAVQQGLETWLSMTAIDTVLHGHALLKIVVGDVQSRNGSVRSVIEVATVAESTARAMRLVQGCREGTRKLDHSVGEEAH